MDETSIAVPLIFDVQGVADEAVDDCDFRRQSSIV